MPETASKNYMQPGKSEHHKRYTSERLNTIPLAQTVYSSKENQTLLTLISWRVKTIAIEDFE